MNSNDLSAYKEVFLKSSKKHIEKCLLILEDLKTDILTPEIIDDLYIHLHSLKGECNTMGYNQIGDRCENALLYLKEEKLRPTNSFNVINSIGDTIDLIKQDLASMESVSEIKNTQTT